MRTSGRNVKLRYLGVLTGAMALCTSAALAEDGLTLSLETGAVWQSRNDVRVPGDSGTRFALDGLTGSGPFAFGRLSADYDINRRHSVRAVYAPYRIQESGVLSDAVDFAGERFAAGAAQGTYQFNAPRATYRYRLIDREQWQFQVGFTLLVRDAEIRLDQDGLRARDTDTGLVPLLHLAGSYALGERWRLAFDLDGLVAPQGRALDLGMRAEYALDERWRLHAGYRTLDGGADNDTVYNFAWLNYAVAGISRRF